MKITYKKLMHVACGQSLALERLEAYLKIFDSYIDKYENTDKFNAENELNWWLKKREEVLMHPVVKSFVNVIFLRWKNGTPIEELLNKKYLKKLYNDLAYDYKLNQIIPKVKEESNGNDN